MINNSTIDKLIEMRLTAMSDAFRQQISDPRMNEISFEERFGMMVDIEYTRRKNNRLDRLIRNADFDQPDAVFGNKKLQLLAIKNTIASTNLDHFINEFVMR